MTEQDLILIRHTFTLAAVSDAKGYGPFAALLTNPSGDIVASSMNQCIPLADPTAHAERILISQYCSAQNFISLEGYSLYSNVEPCLMCTGAIHWSRISRVVFGLSQTALKISSKGNPKPSCRSLLPDRVEVIGPMLEEEADAWWAAYPIVSKKDLLDRYQNRD